MKRLPVLFILAALLFQSCASNRNAASQLSPEVIDKLGYFNSIAHMKVIEKGNQTTPDATLCQTSALLLDSLLQAHAQSFRIATPLSPTDTALNRKVNEEIDFLTLQASLRKNRRSIELSPLIDSVMEANQERFAVAFVATGFSRAKGNYGGQVAKGIGIGILTMGMYVPVLIKANSTIHAVVFDSQTNTVALYQKEYAQDKEPTDVKILNRQVHALLTDLLRNRKS